MNIRAIVTQLSSYGEFHVCVFCSDKVRQYFCFLFEHRKGGKCPLLFPLLRLPMFARCAQTIGPIVHEIDQILVTNRWVGATVVVFLKTVYPHIQKKTLKPSCRGSTAKGYCGTKTNFRSRIRECILSRVLRQKCLSETAAGR